MGHWGEILGSQGGPGKDAEPQGGICFWKACRLLLSSTLLGSSCPPSRSLGPSCPHLASGMPELRPQNHEVPKCAWWPRVQPHSVGLDSGPLCPAPRHAGIPSFAVCSMPACTRGRSHGARKRSINISARDSHPREGIRI